MAFTIEKDVPLPTCYGQRRYPFDQMKPGDSFLINGDATADGVRSAAITFGRSQGRNWKFSIRQTTEGPRCWRVS